MAETAVVVDDVSKRFRLYRERNQSLKAALLRGGRAHFDEFWALRNVSFEIPAGSTFGLIGENGSGKSTLLKCIARILRPNSGSVRTSGSLAALLELGSGFHPELSGRENVYLNGSILGMRKAEVDRKFDAIVDFAGIGEFIDQPVKNYSSGMYVRLGFSVAINVDPDILLVDEVLAVGDASFQEKCMEKFANFRAAGKTVVIVSHSMGSLRTLCDQAAWLKHGKLVGVGDAQGVVDDYVDAGFARTSGGADDDAVHQGSGEVTLSRIEMLGPDGRAVKSLQTEDAVTVRLHFDARERIDRPAFALAIETTTGVYVWGHHTRDGGLVIDSVEGSGCVELRIPALHLQQGNYMLRARALDHTLTHTYDFVRDAYRFDVLAGRPHESGGVAALGSTWHRVED